MTLRYKTKVIVHNNAFIVLFFSPWKFNGQIIYILLKKVTIRLSISMVMLNFPHCISWVLYLHLDYKVHSSYTHSIIVLLI